MAEQIKRTGSELQVLDEHASELHSIIYAITKSSAESKDKRPNRGIDRRLRSDAAAKQRAQHFLMNPESHLRSAGLRYVKVDRDFPTILKYFSPSSVEELISRIRKHGDINSRQVDAEAIAHIGRFLRRSNRSCFDIFQMPAVLVSDNFEVVNEGNRFLLEEKYYDKLHCPPCIMHSHLAAAAWISSGAIGTQIAKDHLIANCMSLVDANAELFQTISHFLEDINPEDAKVFEQSIANDRSALMVASQFVGVAQPIEEQVSASLLTEIVSAQEERLAQIHADKEAILIKRQENEINNLKEKQNSRESFIIKQKTEEINKINTERDKKINDIMQKYQSLQQQMEHIKTNEFDNSKLLQDRIAELETISKKNERKAIIPYFLILTAILIVIANNLGWQNFSTDPVEFLTISLPKWAWSSILLIITVAISWFLTKLGSRLFQ